jgi:hypothetical protein
MSMFLVAESSVEQNCTRYHETGGNLPFMIRTAVTMIFWGEGGSTRA